MAIRTAKIASAILVGIVAGTPLAVVSMSTAQGGECLTEPKQETPKGQHWFYRLEHGTQRHCWYLRGESKGAAEKLTSSDLSPAPKAAARQVGPQTPSSVADAHAELPWPQGPDQADSSVAATAKPAPVAPNSVAAESSPAATADPAGDSTVASRWPDPSSVTSSSAAASPPAPADLLADAQTDTDAQASSDAAPTAAAVAQPKTVAIDATPARDSASLKMLLLVVFGALTLASLTASIVYRLGRRRRRARTMARRRSGSLWESVDNARADEASQTPTQAPWVEPVFGKAAPRVNMQRASDQAGADAEDGTERIEEFIARLTRQLQADMQSPSPR